jgi:hypothetical protein
MPSTPWYRHRWPWIVMSGPALVVAAGLWTWTLAARAGAADGIVNEDSYRRGIAVNAVLDRTRRAGEMEVAARVTFDGPRVRVVLAGAAPPSAGLTLALASPRHTEADQVLRLEPAGGATYEGTLRPIAAGVHRLVLEDHEGLWRLEGAMRGTPAAIELDAPRTGATS